MVRLSHLLRRVCSVLLVGALLFAQLATAAHACPVVQDAAAPAAVPCTEPSLGAMAADDAAPAGLCHEHCQADAQTVDAAQAPVVSAPALLALFTVTTITVPRSDAPTRSAAGHYHRIAPPLAHSIAHCCLRI